MDVILAVDALEHEKVAEYNCVNLMQRSFGRTDIGEFEEPRTVVLWSSFMTGRNREREVLALGDRRMWSVRWRPEETFFSGFRNPLVLDLPGFNYDLKVHERSRELLALYFETEGDERESVLEEYDGDAFKHHREIKDAFLGGLHGGHDLVVGYFSLADTVGHLSFGLEEVMKPIYAELDGLAKAASQRADRLLVISDHGMTAVGRFGDHSNHGFWSLNYEAGLKSPRITDFRRLVEGWRR